VTCGDGSRGSTERKVRWAHRKGTARRPEVDKWRESRLKMRKLPLSMAWSIASRKTT